MIGVYVDTAAVLVCGIIGLIVKKVLPKIWGMYIMKGLALCAIYAGISGAIGGQNVLVVVLSIVLGEIIGIAFDIGGKVDRLAEKAEQKFGKGENENSLAKGLVSSVMILCAGSLSIVGSIQAGLAGDNTLLFTKAIMDGVTAVILGASVGVGVILSSVFVFGFEAGIVLLSQIIAPYLGDYVVSEVACVGSIILVALGFKLLEAIEIDIMDFVPAVFMPIILCRFIK